MTFEIDSEGNFPSLDTWADDRNFRRQMQMRTGEAFSWAEATLADYGKLCGGPVFERAHIVDKENHSLDRFGRWGEDRSEVRHHPLYLENVKDLYGRGVIGHNYLQENQKAGRHASWELMLGWGYLTGGADIGVACPMCMTYGAVYLLEKFGSPALREKFLPPLVSTDPERLQTAGMLLTEITGGSDLVSVSVTARRAPDQPSIPDLEKWLLTGEKWFTSNAGGEQFMVLARPEGAQPGTRGLAVFVMPSKKEDGSPNGIHIRRIKDKIGTRNVATGEMTLEGAEAWLLGDADKGIHYILDMVNLSRLFNAVGSIGLMGRCYSESRRYARWRTAFGKAIVEHPPVQRTLLDMAVKLTAGTALTFEAATVFDKTRQGDQTLWPLLRILTPLSKLITGEWACDLSRETLCLFAGNGTIEGFRVERLYRDAIILPIWEGTANIQCLDVLRAIQKESAHLPLMALVTRKLEEGSGGVGAAAAALIRAFQLEVMTELDRLAGLSKPEVGLAAMGLCQKLGALVQAACLLAEAHWEEETFADGWKRLILTRFIQTNLGMETPGMTPDALVLQHAKALILETEVVCAGV